MAAWFPEGIRMGDNIFKILPGGYAVVGKCTLYHVCSARCKIQRLNALISLKLLVAIVLQLKILYLSENVMVFLLFIAGHLCVILIIHSYKVLKTLFINIDHSVCSTSS